MHGHWHSCDDCLAEEPGELGDRTPHLGLDLRGGDFVHLSYWSAPLGTFLAHEAPALRRAPAGAWHGYHQEALCRLRYELHRWGIVLGPRHLLAKWAPLEVRRESGCQCGRERAPDWSVFRGIALG